VLNTNDPETFWLATTNIILGLVVLACVIVVARGVFQELRLRVTKRSSLPVTDNRAPVIPLVGITMADGGELIEGTYLQPSRARRAMIDEPRISQSED
jgi:hypothetical protein